MGDARSARRPRWVDAAARVLRADPGGRAGAARRPALGPGEPHAAPRRIGTGPGRSGVAGQPPAPTPGTVSFRQPAVIKTNVIPNRKTLFGKKGPRFFLYRNSSNPCSHNRNYSTPNVPRLGSALKVTNTFQHRRPVTGADRSLRPAEAPLKVLADRRYRLSSQALSVSALAFGVILYGPVGRITCAGEGRRQEEPQKRFAAARDPPLRGSVTVAFCLHRVMWKES